MLTFFGSLARTRLRENRRSFGFTLIELLVVVAIIGIIAAILIPNLLDSLQKAKQRRAMSDMQLTGTAWMSWLSDLSSAAAAGRGNVSETVDFGSVFSIIDHSDLEAILVPRFANEIPPLDPWTYAYEFRQAEDPADAIFPFGMRSPAADGGFSGDSYSRGTFIGTDYDQDIVWAAGYFVRWPGGVRGAGS